MNLEVKRAFVLADWMKSAHRAESEEDFLRLLSSESARLVRLTEREIDQIIARDEKRLERFEILSWTLGKVSLKGCFVYPHMGERAWAVGKVDEVAPKFIRLESFSSRIWKMKLFARLFCKLPLIVLKSDGQLKIDDGSHRAVVMFLAGLKSAPAFVGIQKE